MRAFSKVLSAFMLLLVLGLTVCATPNRADAQDPSQYNVWIRDVRPDGSVGEWEFEGTYDNFARAKDEAVFYHRGHSRSGGHWRVSVTHLNQVVFSLN